MADYDGTLKVEGLAELQRKLDELPAVARRQAMKGMRAGAKDIIADAKVNLRSNSSVVTGLLRASGKVQKVDDETLEAGFFSDENQQRGYAAYVEYGRRAGKFPPVDEIEAWLKKKTSVRKGVKSAFNSAAAFMKVKPDVWRRQLAFLIARSIAKNGTKPHPFLAPAVESGWPKLLDRIKKALTL